MLKPSGGFFKKMFDPKMIAKKKKKRGDEEFEDPTYHAEHDDKRAGRKPVSFEGPLSKAINKKAR